MTIIDEAFARTVSIAIAHHWDGGRLWIHIDGVLRCRLYRIGTLTIDDQRPKSAADMGVASLPLRVAIQHVLQRCTDTHGELDAEMIGELKAALEQAESGT